MMRFVRAALITWYVLPSISSSKHCFMKILPRAASSSFKIDYRRKNNDVSHFSFRLGGSRSATVAVAVTLQRMSRLTRATQRTTRSASVLSQRASERARVRIENQRTAAAAAVAPRVCCCTAHGICTLDRAKEEEKVRHVGAPPRRRARAEGRAMSLPERLPLSASLRPPYVRSSPRRRLW